MATRVADDTEVVPPECSKDGHFHTWRDDLRVVRFVKAAKMLRAIRVNP
jgi:hypothetical protein